MAESLRIRPNPNSLARLVVMPINGRKFNTYLKLDDGDFDDKTWNLIIDLVFSLYKRADRVDRWDRYLNHVRPEMSSLVAPVTVKCKTRTNLIFVLF